MIAKLAYKRPDTLDQALDFLSEKKGAAKILAGGTDVMVDLRAKEISPDYLLDVSRLEELHGIRMEGGGLHIGAAVTLSEINSSSILAEHAPAMQKCTHNFASTQIRNVATIGGNVAHCSPCGDTIPPLVIHEAQAVVASPRGEKRIPIEEVATGPYRCFLEADDIITSFILQPRKADFADFQKIGRRKDLAISRLSMAIMLDKARDESVSFFRVCIGACTPTPHRMTAIEDLICGKKLSTKLLFEGGKLLSEKVIEITGRRSSIIYKEPAIQGLFVRMLYPLV